MSLIASVGQGLAQGVQGWLGKVFGANNRSAYGDCQAAVGLYPTDWQQRYPHCVGILGQGGMTAQPGVGVPMVSPGAAQGAVSPLQVAPGAQLQTIAYTGGLTPIPAMGSVPTIVGAGTKLLTSPGARQVVTSAVRASLPTLRRALAIASGFIVTGGLVYDVAGNLIGKTRRRRRMNPLNYRAAKRAARRLCAVQDLCGDIERGLPSRGARSHRRRRRSRKCR